MRLRRARDLTALLLVLGVARGVQAQDKPMLGPGHSKEPITITSDNLEYAYKDGVIVYRGDVLAIQGDVKVRSNELRITLAKEPDNGKGGSKQQTPEFGDTSSSKVDEIVATGNVRIDQGTRWAVGGRATFEQSNRTLVLTENPVMHDGPNEVAGDRVIVFLDEDRSIVEGGRKRVKAVLFPSKEKDEGPRKAGGGGEEHPPSTGP